MAQQYKSFKYYPKFKFSEIKPFEMFFKVGNAPNYDIDNTKQYHNILSCKENDTNKEYLYFIELKRLYEIICPSWLGFLILYDVRLNKYNLMSLWTGKLRFNVYKQPTYYAEAQSNKKLHMFAYCKWYKNKNKPNIYYYDDIKLYNFKISLDEVNKHK